MCDLWNPIITVIKYSFIHIGISGLVPAAI
jgi:hypothetical protein